jgi:hypothetical protein
MQTFDDEVADGLAHGGLAGWRWRAGGGDARGAPLPVLIRGADLQWSNLNGRAGFRDGLRL